MHQNSSDIDSVNIHPDSEKLLIYCQISEKYSLIQKNFDIPSCFYVQLPLLYVKPISDLSRKKH